jgi:hypothetical protein
MLQLEGENSKNHKTLAIIIWITSTKCYNPYTKPASALKWYDMMLSSRSINHVL